MRLSRALLLAPLISAAVAHANADLDRRYSLDTIGTLRSWDNVDGLFGDYVAAAYKEYFARQTRYRLQDLTKADSLLQNSKVPYTKAIEDPLVLGQITRSLKAQSILRTRIYKEGPRYRFTIDWLHAPQMDRLADETFILEDEGASKNGAASDGSLAKEFAGLGDIKGKLQAALARMFAKVPFVGQVTGRDKEDVTVNLGTLTGVKRGDTFVIGTIEEVKKHPLLKEIVEWRLVSVGRAEVDSVDDALAFAHVVQEEEGREVGRFQKIMQVLPKVEKPTPVEPLTPHVDIIDEQPKLGFGALSLWSGSYTRDYSSALLNYSGGGFLFGARGTGQIWFNREFFADLMLGYAAFSYGQHDAANIQSPAGSVGGSAFSMNLDLGYTFLRNIDFFGPRAWVKAGYRSDNYSLPASATEATAPFGVRSFYLGIGGDLPIRDGYGVDVQLDFGLLNGASETGGISGNANSAHSAVIYFGGYWRYRPRLLFKAGLEIQGNGANFGMPATLTQRTITLVPSVEYLF